MNDAFIACFVKFAMRGISSVESFALKGLYHSNNKIKWIYFKNFVSGAKAVFGRRRTGKAYMKTIASIKGIARHIESGPVMRGSEHDKRAACDEAYTRIVLFCG